MLYALVVIYNKKCEDSITLNNIKNNNMNIKIIVFDNSEKDFGNANYCKDNNYVYYTLNKNVGLSRAYNYVINKIVKKNNNYIIILDDDTYITKEYFDEVVKTTSEQQYDIILPVVKSKKDIISPSNIQFNCRVSKIKNVKDVSINNITAINSGMVVKTTIYDDILYNEKLFLDYVDHDFMKKIRVKKYRIYIMKTQINQNFSRNQKDNLKNELIRFKIYKRDFKEYCKECNKKMFYYINILKYKIKLCIKYKKIIFIIK